ncbi:MAG: hypothetical protein IH914_07935 [candidate division Zixibacteria bacterium]|nr:hypothetical protein [candidate division Zixibacteria bacterium]
MSLFSNIPPAASESEAIPDEEYRVLNKLAEKIVEWRMAAPALITLETSKPLNYIASQGMVFFGPIIDPMVQMFFNFHDYDILRQALERRSNIENLMQMIERYDAHAGVYDRMVKKFFKSEKKKWKWYQRYFGINTPKIEPPDQIKNYNWRKAARDEAESARAGDL